MGRVWPAYNVDGGGRVTELMGRSRTDDKAPPPWVRCYDIRVWRDWHRQDSHDARREESGRQGNDT